MISKISPCTPTSAISKKGAFSSLLITTIFFDPFIPTTCCIAPEIPKAKYSLGETLPEEHFSVYEANIAKVKLGKEKIMLFELRQYQMKPGSKAEWLKLMEEEIIPLQVQKGMVIVGSFVGEEDENIYVWIRRFTDEEERKRLYKDVYESKGRYWRRVVDETPELDVVVNHIVDQSQCHEGDVNGSEIIQDNAIEDSKEDQGTKTIQS